MQQVCISFEEIPEVLFRGIAGGTVAQVALAWLLRQPAVSSVIIGATKMSQLEDNIKAAFLKLSDEQVRVPVGR